MCELPARSMPGSEMLFVEKTRIRGTKAGASTWASPATDAVMGRRLLAPTGTVPMPFFASRRGPGQAAPRASTTLSAVMASSSDSVMVAGMVPFSLVDEAVGRGGDLGDESTGGHDFGAFDEVRGGDSAAVHTRR